MNTLPPQYMYSEYTRRRFLEAIQNETNTDITRSNNELPIKSTEVAELAADSLTYFHDKKADFESEFCGDLAEAIGTKKATAFIHVVAGDWLQGNNSVALRELKASVRKYLTESRPGSAPIAELVIQGADIDVDPSFTRDEIRSVLAVTQRMFDCHIHRWLNQRPDTDDISSTEVYLRRGLDIVQPFADGARFPEWDVINSYSLSVSTPEQFALDMNSTNPVIVHADVGYFCDCILFFSPFVPGMQADELEVGILPRRQLAQLRYLGIYSSVHEYLLDPLPWI